MLMPLGARPLHSSRSVRAGSDPAGGYAIYPAGRTSTERLTYLLQFAAFVPTFGKTIPFRFRLRDDAVDLYVAELGDTSASDRGRAAAISAGAALHHLRVAFEAFGEDAVVEEFPAGNSGDLVARVTLAARTAPSPDAQRMLVAAARRRDTRASFRPSRVPGPLVKAFANECRRERTVLRVIVGDERDALVERLAPAPERAAMLAGSPLFLTITTNGDGPSDWVAAGRALSAVLLRATESGLATSQFEAMVTGPEPGLRGDVAALIRAERAPQALVRVGVYDGPSIAASPRIALEDIVF
jgi:hypothetical protein